MILPDFYKNSILDAEQLNPLRRIEYYKQLLTIRSGQLIEERILVNKDDFRECPERLEGKLTSEEQDRVYCFIDDKRIQAESELSKIKTCFLTLNAIRRIGKYSS